ncbi:MAG: AMP-binding protein [Spirochaetaceae bacterium]|nr:AMP-binding protein [Spirochaetaceae bacterium]
MFEITLSKLLRQKTQEYPDKEFIVYSDRDLRFTYKQFNERVSNLAKGFLSIGVKKGDHLGIWATNVPDWLTIMFAAARIGAICVTVNTNYKLHELEYLVKQSDITTLCLADGFKDSDYVKMVNDLVPEIKQEERGYLTSNKFPFLKNVIFIGQQKHRGMFSLSELMLVGSHATDDEMLEIENSLNHHDVVNMQYTSGTTGFPKGVMLTHYNIINNGFSIGSRQKFTAAEKLCLPVPLFHCFGITLGVMAILTHGGTLVILETFDPLLVLASVQKEKCTALYGVPTMFIAELNHPMFDMFDLSSLRTGIMAGSPCPMDVMRKVIDKMHMKDITIVFGLTESSPGMTQTRADDPVEKKVSTVGTEFDGVEVKVLDPETGKESPIDVPGELCCRGYNVMKGYYKMPEETAKVIDKDGWLHSGDLGVKDKDGFFSVTGRIKDMIIRGGENIYPREIEEFLYLMKGIRDVQVAGIADEKYGEVAGAFIIREEGVALTEEDVIGYCRGKISRFKIPQYIFFIDSFPMTGSGKIQKYKLREMGNELVKTRREK